MSCRLGRIEYDGARYCHEHGGFLEPGVGGKHCDRAGTPQPQQPTNREDHP